MKSASTSSSPDLVCKSEECKEASQKSYPEILKPYKDGELEWTLVLVGKTGHGKSSTANTLMGHRHFRAANAMNSITRHCQLGCKYLKSFNGSPLTLHIIDTPGLFDTISTKEEIVEEIKRCRMMAYKGIHAFILVLSCGRITDEEYQTIAILQKVFGRKVKDYCIVLFTKIDQLDEEDTFEMFCETMDDKLKAFIDTCKGRFIGFNNKLQQSNSESVEQVNHLLQLVNELLVENDGAPYSNKELKELEVEALENDHNQKIKLLQEWYVNIINGLIEDETIKQYNEGGIEKYKCTIL